MYNYIKMIIPITLIIFITSCQKISPIDTKQYACKDYSHQEYLQSKIIIKYPFCGTYFPHNFSAPTFRWKDLASKTKKWIITFHFNNNRSYEVITTASNWTPSRFAWEKLIKLSQSQKIYYSIVGLDKNGKEVSKSNSNFVIDRNNLNTPIFYRSVPLPFPNMMTERLEMSWKLGRVSDYTPPRTLMTGKTTCINCHTSSANGKMFGIEINTTEHDRASYIEASITDKINLKKKDIFNWNNQLPDKNKKKFSANLSAFSPDGKFLVSAVHSSLFFIDYPESTSMVSYFYPQQGILAYKEVGKPDIHILPGADNLDYIHTSPVWSPDGKYITFARARRRVSKQESKKQLLEKTWRGLDQEKNIKFDIYRIPFNNGKGGIATPLVGASNNNKSNYFPQYSPDGKWLVFTQASSGFGIRPDGDLVIIPSAGGKARKLSINGEHAESWHNWSPDSKWLAFVSKSYSNYTQLLITRIGKYGEDKPPVIVTRFDEPGMAINMPVFINNNQFNRIETDIK